ncbi:unnamed protein product [Cladocopium goreaui]|uniref:Cation-chloride cotransporter 1 n=1 Tax=Cladocopium goreaui TaxID=2562237 RepID=A0A9P1FWW5_9DINO|nr:unnamed protein product [Cladocopium goreaui]
MHFLLPPSDKAVISLRLQQNPEACSKELRERALAAEAEPVENAESADAARAMHSELSRLWLLLRHLRSAPRFPGESDLDLAHFPAYGIATTDHIPDAQGWFHGADEEGLAYFQTNAQDVSDTPASRRARTWSTSTPKFLGNEVLSSEDLKTQRTESGLTQCRKDKKGALTGVFIPTCENMWGVLIFLRFYYIVGEAGIWQTLCAVLLSFAAAFCATCAMSSIASSGGLVSSGGPYYMISRALGPVVGATIGIMYWLAITMLSVLECLGAVEALAMAAPSMRFPGFRQALGSASMALLALAVWGGMNIVTKLGLLFALVVVFTLFSFYLGLFMTGPGTVSPDVPGSEYETFQSNWSPHYDSNVGFGTVLSLFYPCFTGILSGANRADVLKDPPRNIRIGTFGAIVFSFFLYTSFFLLWGSVATDTYLKGNFLDDPHARRLSSGGDISEEAGRRGVAALRRSQPSAAAGGRKHVWLLKTRAVVNGESSAG